MKIAIGADHGGYPLNEQVIEELRAERSRTNRLRNSRRFHSRRLSRLRRKVGEAVQTGASEIGILICGSGVGAAVAANKLRGIRAALCGDTYSAHQSREHDDCNVLCLGARITGVELALDIVRAFVAARFTGEERHRRRLAKIEKLEECQPQITQSSFPSLRPLRLRDLCVHF